MILNNTEEYESKHDNVGIYTCIKRLKVGKLRETDRQTDRQTERQYFSKLETADKGSKRLLRNPSRHSI